MTVKDCYTDQVSSGIVGEPYHALECGERNRTIQEKVDLLPDFQKAMIILFHQEMLSYEEIAKTFDMPIGTVKSRLNRARLNLRFALDKDRSLFDLPKRYLL